MKSNGGIIGSENIPTTDTASGIWGMRQIFNAVSDEIWPEFVYTVNITQSPTSVDEGESVTVSVSSNLPNGTYNWVINSVTGTIDTDDFIQNTSGTVNIINGMGSFILDINEDENTEGSESFSVSILNSSNDILGESNTVTINDTSLDPLPIVTNGLLLHVNTNNPNSYSGSGTEWYDLSGNGFHMKLNGGINYNSSEKLFELDGSDDYGVCDGSISGSQSATVSNLGIGGSTEKTVVALVEVREVGSTNQGLFDVGDTGSAGRHYCLRLNASYTSWRAQFWSTPDYDFSYDGRNNLVMYSVTYRSDQIGRTFVNNANLVGQDSGSYSLNTAGSRPFEMGRYNGGNNAGIRAAAYLVYNRGLSDSEIQQNYSAFQSAYNI